MTDPLVPADCDLRDFPFMPLDVARLRDSDLASDEPPEACWAAVLLWCASWHQVPAASIPNSEAWIAKAAGYLSRGKIDPAWKRVRNGALRGWIECDDGRLYHPVVAEKARDAWRGKLEQRWRSECARVRKHNERHGTSVPTPQMDAWISGGCVSADFRNVTCDKTPMSHGQTEIVTDDTTRKSHESHAENASKRQGERKGQGEVKEKEKDKHPTGVGAQPEKPGTEHPGPQVLVAQEPPSTGIPPCPHERIRALWAEVLPKLPQHRIWTETRRKHLQTRWRDTAVDEGWKTQEQGVDWFRKLFVFVGESQFLTGRAPSSRPGQPPFVCELEWLLLPSNWAKVIEGKYHQEAA